MSDAAGYTSKFINPFVFREGITHATDFFNRKNEQNVLRNYLYGRGNCQIVGSRRIGKTSLLRFVERNGLLLEETSIIVYLDLQDPRCFTLAGWLARTSLHFGFSTRALNLAEFAEYVEEKLAAGHHLVLCLDEFEELTLRPIEFSRDFFVTLRACGQQGMSILTASQKRLSDLTEPSDPTSPFYNTFPLLLLNPFSKKDAQDFVTLPRTGVRPFTLGEQQAIIEFARGHPLALQVACFHVLEAKEYNESLITALQKSADNMKAHLPNW